MPGRPIEADLAGTDPGLAQVEQVEIDLKQQQGHHQIAGTTQAGVHARTGHRHDHQVQCRQGKTQAPGNFTQVMRRRFADQLQRGDRVERDFSLAAQLVLRHLDAVALELTELEVRLADAVFQTLAVAQNEKTLVADQLDAAAARRGHGFLAAFGGGNEHIAGGMLAQQAFLQKKHAGAARRFLELAGLHPVQVATIFIVGAHVFDLLVRPGQHKQRQCGDGQQNRPGKTQQGRQQVPQPDTAGKPDHHFAVTVQT